MIRLGVYIRALIRLSAHIRRIDRVSCLYKAYRYLLVQPDEGLLGRHVRVWCVVLGDPAHPVQQFRGHAGLNSVQVGAQGVVSADTVAHTLHRLWGAGGVVSADTVAHTLH